MKTPRILLQLSALSLLAAAAPAVAQVPSLLNYQGRVTVSGTNFTGNGQFKFALVDGGTDKSRQATATAVVSNGKIVGIDLVFGGMGYATAPVVKITDTTGASASVAAQVNNSKVTGFVINNSGSNYSPNAVVSIGAPPADIVYETYWRNDGSTNSGAPTNAVIMPVAQGLYSALLGDAAMNNMAPIPENVFTNSDVRLRVWFSEGGTSGFEQLSPDQRIGAAGYAIRAASADSAVIVDPVGDFSVGGNLTVGGSLSVEGFNVGALVLYSGYYGRNIIAGYGGNFVSPNIVGATIAGGGMSNSFTGVESPNSVSGLWGTVSGGIGNEAGNTAAAVGGGDHNTAGGAYSVAGGGYSNAATGYGSVVGGGWANAASGIYSAVGGGRLNTASTNYATVGGGYTNSASGATATVAGGSVNEATGSSSTVGGGNNNTASGMQSTIGGGYNNTASATAATTAGGRNNSATDSDSTVGGGRTNTASGLAGVVGGGIANSASGDTAAVLGGESNSGQGYGSSVGGGYANVASNSYSTIGGGFSNSVTGSHAVVGGGNLNRASVDYASIAGGYGNNAGGYSAAIGGGYANVASTNYATIAGGYRNQATGAYASIGGGETNVASGSRSTIGGGSENTASGTNSTVGGGFNCNATQPYATVAGGESCGAHGRYAAVGGGSGNYAPGQYATIPGGLENEATEGSFAAGVGAHATNANSFVWSGSDDPYAVSVGSFTNGSFCAYAPGGFYLYTLDPNGSYAAGSGGAFIRAGESQWRQLSDVASKTNFAPIDAVEILNKLSAMPISAWEYKQAPGRRYIGPTAQDFHKAFHLGEDDKSIGTMDSGNIALTAIKGLVEELKVRDERIAELEARTGRLEQLENEIRTIREQMGNLPPTP